MLDSTVEIYAYHVYCEHQALMLIGLHSHFYIIFLPCFGYYCCRKKLIMVGSRGTLSTIPLLRFLVDKVAEIGGLLEMTNNYVHSLREPRGSRLNGQ